ALGHFLDGRLQVADVGQLPQGRAQLLGGLPLVFRRVVEPLIALLGIIGLLPGGVDGVGRFLHGVLGGPVQQRLDIPRHLLQIGSLGAVVVHPLLQFIQALGRLLGLGGGGGLLIGQALGGALVGGIHCVVVACPLGQLHRRGAGGILHLFQLGDALLLG